MQRDLNKFLRLCRSIFKHPGISLKALLAVPESVNGKVYASNYSSRDRSGPAAEDGAAPENPLFKYFQEHVEGPGIWKWEHYFEVYHRHLAKFIGQRVDVVEIGIYSGGSLAMWRSYFGAESHIYGVDIEPDCKVYKDRSITVFTGDQADRTFWTDFRETVGAVDIIIDDGGHTPEQQRITLEEMLPYLRPGGVYICEDIHGSFDQFSSFIAGLADGLNCFDKVHGETLQTSATPFQSAIHSIHFYPYLVVIERNSAPKRQFIAPKHGTEWQPFLK